MSMPPIHASAQEQHASSAANMSMNYQPATEQQMGTVVSGAPGGVVGRQQVVTQSVHNPVSTDGAVAGGHIQTSTYGAGEHAYTSAGRSRGGRGRGAARGGGAGAPSNGGPQSRATFYGREVSKRNEHGARGASAANADRAPPQPPTSERQPAPTAVASGEAPPSGSSRRYLAGRVDNANNNNAAHAGAAGAAAPAFTVTAAPGQATGDNGHLQVAMPTMVPVQGGMHQQTHSIHLNPNAPGFLPVGDHPAPQQAAGAGFNPQGALQGSGMVSLFCCAGIIVCCRL